ncbi:MAG: hypothetical protein JXR64_11980 [Spirochaetales bacterium]|nr:hypothetical protein [Spirochaetales bacterium]
MFIIATTIPGIYDPHNLRTRRIGSVYAIDLHINIKSENTIEYGHNLINQLEDKIKKELGNDLICNIQIDPL